MRTGSGGPVAIMVIGPAIHRADIPTLCARLLDLTARYAERVVVVCDVGSIAEPTVVTVDALVRLRLTALRLGTDIRVRGAHVRLRQLLAFTGVAELVPIEGGSAPVPHRQPEEREQSFDVEEVGDPTDPVA